MVGKPLVKVHLWSGLRALAGGSETVELRAATIGQMLDALIAKHPALDDAVNAGVSVSIDGRIHAQDVTCPVSAENEIYLLQRIKGG